MALLPVELDDIRFRYGRNSVLRGVSLSVAAGEVVALLGPNGAGKTTLFSILTGRQFADHGDIRFAGEVCTEVDLEHRARIAHVAHRPEVYPQLSALENLELFHSLRAAAGQGEGGKREELRTWLGRLGLASSVDRMVSTFSRGMAQRVALARALSSAPELLIMDEPFTALDPGGRAELGKRLREASAGGTAILVASHDLDAIAAVAHRALVLRDGVIAARIARPGGDDETAVRGEFRRALAEGLGALSLPPTAVVA